MSLPGIVGMHGLVGAVASNSDGFTGGPDANTLFLSRFNTATPKNEVGSVNGTLVGNANCDLAQGQLVCDGTGDWATWAGGSTFDPTTNWTVEYHIAVGRNETGGTCCRTTSGNPRWSFFFVGDGRVQFFMDIFDNSIPMLAVAPANGMDGNEHHLAVVRDGGTWYSYLDGTQSSSRVSALAPSSSSDDFFVGTDALVSSSRDLICRIGRVKISNVARYPGGTTFTPPTRFVA